MNELNRVMIKKLALNISYHLVAPLITKVVLSDAIDRKRLEPMEAFGMQSDAEDYTLDKLELGELSVSDFISDDTWHEILGLTTSKLEACFKQNPDDVKEMFNDYMEYMNSKYPTMS